MMNIGFTYQSRITIWKDPVTEMQRTKAHGLLHKNFSTHAEKTRVGNPDYLLIFSKKGDAETPVTHTDIQIGEYVGTNPPSVSDYTGHGKPEKVSWSIATWQRYASPVWMDIDQTRTLNERNARSEQDERHICPLQLDVIARGIHWFTNKGETVFSPFAGIGSEGYEAIRMGRKFIGIELKEEYFNEAVKNLNEAERQTRQKTLFDLD
jgi:DNA modification methylase